MVAILELHLVAQITAHLQYVCVRALQYKRQPLIHNRSITNEAKYLVCTYLVAIV